MDPLDRAKEAIAAEDAQRERFASEWRKSHPVAPREEFNELIENFLKRMDGRGVTDCVPELVGRWRKRCVSTPGWVLSYDDGLEKPWHFFLTADGRVEDRVPPDPKKHPYGTSQTRFVPYRECTGQSRKATLELLALAMARTMQRFGVE